MTERWRLIWCLLREHHLTCCRLAHTDQAVELRCVTCGLRITLALYGPFARG